MQKMIRLIKLTFYVFIIINGLIFFGNNIFNSAQANSGLMVGKMQDKAKKLAKGSLEEISVELKQTRDTVREQRNEIRYLRQILKKVENVSESTKNNINYFITYGVDENSQKLGAGERAAAVGSFIRAYGYLPGSEGDLFDLIKIVNGRYPGKFSKLAEEKAYDHFYKIYNRWPDVKKNPNDNSAIKIMAYGLRQKFYNRNLHSEEQGIKIFKYFYGHLPQTTEEWDIMQAITYSGATRDVFDIDNDGLSEKMEEIYDTDKNNPDTDSDGYIDGVEVVNGYNPLSGMERIKYQNKKEDNKNDKTDKDKSKLNEKKGKTYLGVVYISVNKEQAKTNNLEEKTGVFIKSVIDNGPADKAGIKKGDIILQMGDVKVSAEGENNLKNVIKTYNPGDEVQLIIISQNQQKTVNVILGGK